MNTRATQAFTLIELLIVVAIFGIAAPFLVSIPIESAKAQRENTVRTAVAAETRNVFDAIGRDVRGAVRVLEPGEAALSLLLQGVSGEVRVDYLLLPEREVLTRDGGGGKIELFSLVRRESVPDRESVPVERAISRHLLSLEVSHRNEPGGILFHLRASLGDVHYGYPFIVKREALYASRSGEEGGE